MPANPFVSQPSGADQQSRFYWQLQDALRSAFVVERASAELYLPECAAAAVSASGGGRAGGSAGGLGQAGRAHIQDRYWLLLVCAADALHTLLDCFTFGDLLRLRAPDEASRSAFERLCTLLGAVTSIEKSKSLLCSTQVLFALHQVFILIMQIKILLLKYLVSQLNCK